MMVVIVETDEYPIAIVGMSADDVEKCGGVLPLVDLKEACFIAGIMRPPVAVQILIGESDEDILTFLNEMHPEADFTVIGRAGDTIEQASANAQRARAEHMLKTTPGALN